MMAPDCNPNTRKADAGLSPGYSERLHLKNLNKSNHQTYTAIRHSLAWWRVPVIFELRKQREMDCHKFEANMGLHGKFQASQDLIE